MKISYRWLREWVALRLDPPALAERLTLAGLEAGAIAPVAPSLEGVVVGKVRRVSAHPATEELKICDVEAGRGRVVRVVCGAPNAAAGMKAPLALPGAVLPGDRRIEATTIREVESAGMLCSAAELGLESGADDGLLVLDPGARTGAPLAEALALDDVTLELELTPNRGDCLSVVGVAREVAAITGARLTVPPVRKARVKARKRVAVKISARQACPRYAGRVVQNIDSRAPTPLWMRERLRRAGIRCLHPAVDVTNYVMLELGQPMHAFDLDKLRGAVRVRVAGENESLTLLDGRRLTAPAGSLLIADDRGAIALAGIMGGEETAVGAQSQAVFLESAFFRPDTIARHARALGIQTESSQRFERGVDPELQVRALERATELLLRITGGEAGPITEARVKREARGLIALRARRLARVLGGAVSGQKVERALKGLAMQVRRAKDGWRVVPPSYRFDISIEADLIEEVARITGYGDIQARPPSTTVIAPDVPESRLEHRRLRALLIDRDYQEVITYSFIDPALERLIDPAAPALMLANPISADMAAMRTTLWPGLLQALRYNRNRQQQRIRIFEIGRRFRGDDNGVREEAVIAGAVTGLAEEEQWGAPKRQVDFYDGKGDVEGLLALTGMPEQFRFSSAAHPALHPGQTAAIYLGGEQVGWLGALSPALQTQLELGAVALFEIELAALVERRAPAFREVSRFPAIRRDLAIVVAENTAAQSVLHSVRKAAGNLLVNVQLFDVYRGEGIDSGRKSLALGLTLQDSSRTLREAEVDTLMTRVVSTLRAELGAELRH